jgi:histidinol-phosphate aminotransferase
MPNTDGSISRRRFAQWLGVGAASAVVSPSLARTNSLLHGLPLRPDSGAATVVRLSANENPYGPSPMALKAMTEAFSLSCRYPDEHADVLIDTLAKLNGIARDQILLGDGSGEILKLCAAAFTGPLSISAGRPVELAPRSRGSAIRPFAPGRGKMIVADPTFEAILNHARVNGADLIKVPLTASFAHDLTKMSSAANEGLIYICNPNNPTASITPKNEMRAFIDKTPRETMILVDEAYHHYADSADYESVIPLVKDHSNLIVARTFSKIFGMAGLRLGYCVAQLQTIERLRPHQVWDSVNIMAIVAGTASLADGDQVTNGRKLNSETKRFVLGELEAMGFKSIPSEANFIMIDVKRPMRPLMEGLRQRGVQVGRVFPALPNHMRVTIGRRPEMETFLSSFKQVAASV